MEGSTSITFIIHPALELAVRESRRHFDKEGKPSRKVSNLQKITLPYQFKERKHSAVQQKSLRQLYII